MLAPTLIPPVDWPGASEWPAVAFLRNGGDTEFLPVPFVLAAQSSVFSPPICVQGFRSFALNCQVTSALGQCEPYFNILDPRDHTRVVHRFALGDFIQQDSLNCVCWGPWGVLEPEGGEIVPQVMKIELQNLQLDAATVARLDGLWCSAA